MQKNVQEVWEAFIAGRSVNKGGASIWTDGNCIYGYYTVLVARFDGGRMLFNDTRYSVTTTRHQNALAELLDLPSNSLSRLKFSGRDVIRMEGVPMGTSATALRALARKEGVSV